MYKGKYREGRDKADPTMWKTRLRCALNKSTDFVEVPERNQLDITEPYKVYRLQQDTGQVTAAGKARTKSLFILLTVLHSESFLTKFCVCVCVRICADKGSIRTHKPDSCYFFFYFFLHITSF